MIIILISILFMAVYIVVCGVSAYYLLLEKGYKDKGWIGYVLGVIGVIYCAGLPDLKTRQMLKYIKNNLESNK